VDDSNRARIFGLHPDSAPNITAGWGPPVSETNIPFLFERRPGKEMKYTPVNKAAWKKAVHLAGGDVSRIVVVDENHLEVRNG
jgi:hypothetical protein